MSSIEQTIIIAYSYLPALALMVFFWWLDRFHRQPLSWVIVSFCWGAFGAGFFSYFLNTFFQIGFGLHYMGLAESGSISSVVLAPAIEEFTKAVFLLVLLYRQRLVNITDGILYGMAIGLGFAAAENVSYAKRIYDTSGALAMWNNLWFREIATTVVHAASSAVLGAMLGYALFFKRQQKAFLIVNGFVLACSVHGLWNYLVIYSSGFTDDANPVDGFLFVYLMCLFFVMMLAFIGLVRQEGMTIRRELEAESTQGIFPLQHVDFLSSFSRPDSLTGLKNDESLNEYIDVSEKLVSLRMISRLNPSEKRELEILNLREMILSLQSTHDQKVQ